MANHQSPPPLPSIFKLTVDCCDEIFDYLSLKDLHSFGQTCKIFNKVAGKYFKRNHRAAAKFSGDDGIYTTYSDNKGISNERIQTSTFNKYITYISHYYYNLWSLQYIMSHGTEFESISHIYLVCMNITKPQAEYLKALLPKVETLQIRNSTIGGDVYDDVLKLCSNLKRLLVQDADFGSFRFLDSGNRIRIENAWLLQQYPKLEFLEFIPKTLFKIDELNEFFAKNSTVRAFSTSSKFILENRIQMLKSDVKLDTLEVKFFTGNAFFYDPNPSESDDEDDEPTKKLKSQSIYEVLNQLYDNGFYKRLHFYVESVDAKTSAEMVTVNGVEKLCIRNFTHAYNLSHLTNIKELAILNGANPIDMKIFADNFVNLRRLYVNNATIDDILPFIQRSPNLSKIKGFPKDEASFSGGILKLMMLNEEREKLPDAQKVAIYVPDNIFLETKWTIGNGNIDLRLVEMKRSDSLEWDHHY